MTSLRGPGERNFNAVSHKPTRAPIQFNSIQSVPVSFGLWDTALKFLFPGPRSDVTDHLDSVLQYFLISMIYPKVKLLGYNVYQNFTVNLKHEPD